MVKNIISLILGILIGLGVSYVQVKTKSTSKYTIMDCVGLDRYNYRILDIGDRNYFVQHWWGDNFSANNLADQNVVVLLERKDVDKNYELKDCYELIRKADEEKTIMMKQYIEETLGIGQ